MTPAPHPLPSGTVTFLFNDIEDSTRLLQQVGQGFEGVLVVHQRLLREAFGSLYRSTGSFLMTLNAEFMGWSWRNALAQGGEPAAAAWAEDERMSTEEAVALALAEGRPVSLGQVGGGAADAAR